MASEQLLARLRAWRAVLRNLGTLQIHESDEGQSDASRLVLRVDAGRLSEYPRDATLQSASEALSTLSLLALWTEVDLQPLLDAQYKRRREVVMGLRLEVDDAGSLEPLVARMLFEDGFSPEFRDLLLAIEGMISHPILQGNARRWPHIEVPVHLTLKCPCVSCEGNALKHFEDAEACLETKKILSSILRVARVQQHDAEHNHRPEMVMKIDVVEFAGQDCTVESHEVMLLGRLVECGIDVRELPAITEYIPVDHAVQDATNVHVTRALRLLLAATGTPQSSKQTGLRRVTISGLTSFSYTCAVLSAVQQSQSLQHVIVEDLVGISEAADRNMYWRWFAFGLFSLFATHQILTLELRLPQWRMGDVTAIHSILAADNFLSLLEGTTKQPVLLRTSTFHLERFAGDGETQLVLYTSDTPIDVWLLGETELGGPWMKVLLPGSETAWVGRDEVEVLGPPTHNGSAMKARSFPTVIVRGVPQGAMRTITALLRFIGHSVKRLEVHAVEYDNAEGDEWIHQLLLECPSLEELRIESSEIRHLSPLLDCLLSNKRRLRRLKIDAIHNRRCGDIGAFFRALHDLEGPLAPSLEELDVNVGCVRQWPTMNAIEEMVAQTHRLRSLRVHIRVNDNVGPHNHRPSAFSFEPGEIETIHRHPLDASSKLAFLSVVHHESGSATVRNHLDAHQLTSIFQFAGHLCTRVLRYSVV